MSGRTERTGEGLGGGALRPSPSWANHITVPVEYSDTPLDLEAWARIAAPILLEIARERLAAKALAEAA